MPVLCFFMLSSVLLWKNSYMQILIPLIPVTSPSCWPQLISRECWSCYLLRCFHAAAFMAATLPSPCKSLCNAGTRGGGGKYNMWERERGAECLSNPSTSSWRPLTGEITTAAELSADLAFFIRDTCRQNKESFIKRWREGLSLEVCVFQVISVSTDVTGLYMFNTKWRLTILCQLVIPSSSFFFFSSLKD